MSTENLENASKFHGWGLTLTAYEKSVLNRQKLIFQDSQKSGYSVSLCNKHISKELKEHEEGMEQPEVFYGKRCS